MWTTVEVGIESATSGPGLIELSSSIYFKQVCFRLTSSGEQHKTEA